MAVRAFDLSAPQATRLGESLPAPLGRAERRRLRQRWGLVGVLALTVPFVAAVLVVGVTH